MDDFSLEHNFCEHFKYLRENMKVFVSFNIDRCPHFWMIRWVSLHYNNKLDVEDEKSMLDKFTVKCKLNVHGCQIPCEITTYISDFHYGIILFNKEFAYIIQTLNIDDQLMRLLYVTPLLADKDTTIFKALSLLLIVLKIIFAFCQ